MKIGILTQPLHNNYGGLLQNYALQQVLIRAGQEVETLDQQNKKYNRLHVYLYRQKMRLLHILFPNKYSKVRYQPNDNEQAIIRKNTNHFINTYINRSPSIHSFEDFKSVAETRTYDAYVVGSDQCWRPCYNQFLSSMFLDFVKDKQVKRIAYAASFGTDEWELTPEQTEIATSLVQKFDIVTVREDSGVGLCKKHLGVDAIHVLDPTMLLTKEDYIRLIEQEKEPVSIGNLFNYILDPNAKKSVFIQRVAGEKGLKPFQVLPKYQQETRTKKNIKNNIEDCVFPSVTSWLRAFMDAEMTIVDSFHGMVFSIIFNKPFWVIGNARRGMSRFTSLLKIFKLENRLIDVDSLNDVDINRPIDWTFVNSIVEQKRKKCINLLLAEISK
ncbi:MAG: polysaccharide pyruvyl transferase family protein [Candidatus Aphodosoma sp.]